tara:strand:+ start:22371 stop:22715 length:345 start_codon:yes stop_codon:yes gene_type:complete
MKKSSGKTSFSIAVAAALFVSIPVIAAAQNEQPPAADPLSDSVLAEAANTEATEPAETEVAENDPDEVVCHMRRQTGSNFRERICVTRRLQEQSEQAAERSLERMRRGQAFSPD